MNRKKREILEKIYFSVLSINPLNFIPKDRNLILFGAMGGKFYGDNSKYVFEWMLKEKKEYKCVWITNDKKTYSELDKKGYPVVISKSLKGIIFLARANVANFTNNLLDLTFFPPIVPKNIKLVSLRHGRSVKKVRFARERDKISLIEKLLRYQEKKLIKYVISTSKFISKIQEDCLRVGPDKHIITGYPRNDYLYNPPQIYNKFTGYNKIFLYAPTWRHGRYATDFFPFNDFDFNRLKIFLEDKNFLLLLRPHKNDLMKYSHLVNKIKDFTNKSENIILASHREFNDVNCLLSFVDVLITDYSALYHDFLLLNRPILFIPYDFDSFKKESGFLYDYFKYLPGEQIASFSSLLDSFEDIAKGQDKYAKKRKKLRDIIFEYQDNDSCERVSILIDGLMNKNE